MSSSSICEMRLYSEISRKPILHLNATSKGGVATKVQDTTTRDNLYLVSHGMVIVHDVPDRYEAVLSIALGLLTCRVPFFQRANHMHVLDAAKCQMVT